MHTPAYGPGLKGKRRRKTHRVDADQFRTARRFSGLSRDDAADLVGVSLRTIGHWETGRARPSFAAFKLLRIYRHGDLIDPRWAGYSIIRGKLVTPENHTFEPHDLSWLSLLVRRAKGFSDLLAERDRSGRRSTERERRATPAANGVAAELEISTQMGTMDKAPSNEGAYRQLPTRDRSASGVDQLPFVTVSAQYPPLPTGDDYAFSGVHCTHSWNGTPFSNTGLIPAGGAQ